MERRGVGLLLAAIAIFSVSATARRHLPRATGGALAAAGWITAVIVAVIPVSAIGVSRLPFGVERSLTFHEPGHYIALGCAALLTFLGLLLTALPVDSSPKRTADGPISTKGIRAE